jgi:hypothetical protein
VESEEIEIRITVDREEAADMTYGAREKWLGKMAEAQLAESIPPRPPMTGGSKRNRWKPYTRESIAQALKEWARLHDGKAPTKRDWSPERDPESIWPRPAGESFIRAIKGMAHADGINLNTRAPHLDDPEHRARRAWHEVQSWKRLEDGRLESSQGSRGLMEAVARWEPSAEEDADYEALKNTPEPGLYCLDCFHGSGCQPPEMSPWQYAVEVIGGLQVRTGGDHHATRSERNHFGRNRQMVTAGAADVHPEPSDPAARAAIETIDAG